MRLKVSSATLVLSFLATQAQAQQAKDIAGIKVGAPLSTQKAALSKANPAYRVTDIKDQAGHVLGLRATVKKGKHVTDHLLVLSTTNGLVWFVGREQQLPESGRIALDTFVSSVKSKFGEPSSIVGLQWGFDRSGKRLSFATSSACSPRRKGSRPDPMGQIESLGLNVPTYFPSECGLQVESHYVELPQKGVVSAFAVQIADLGVKFDELKADQAGNAAKQKQSLDAVRGNKPSL